MAFDFWQTAKLTQELAPSDEYHLFQQIGSAFQHMAMHIDKEISVAMQTNFTDRIRLKGMIVGLEHAPVRHPDMQKAAEDDRLAQQAQAMVAALKALQHGIEQHANHVTCRMHDFRCYLMTAAASEQAQREAVYVRALDCVNQALGDLIMLKEHTKEVISRLTLHAEDAARMFVLFDALELAYHEITSDMQAKLRLLNATLSR